MEIKSISGVISTYKTTKAQAPKKTSAAVSAKKSDRTDRVEFGFDKALGAAKAAISQEIRADATAEELSAAQNTLESGVSSAELAALFFMG